MSTNDVEVRDNLMMAACRVIGRKGYKAASISRIAEEAGISIGHCYKFFPSRDAILENVILWVLEKFEDFAERKLVKTQTLLEFEHQALSLYLEFQRKYPFFITILRDSQVETPDTWKQFIERRYERYMITLNDAYDRGEIHGYTRDQLPYLNSILSAIRKAIIFDYSEKSDAQAAAIQTYDQFVRQAFGYPKAD